MPIDSHLSTRSTSRTKWLWICCPRTGEEVVSYLEDPFDMFESPAAWWECPACGSWHIAMIDELKDLREQIASAHNIAPWLNGLIFKTLTPRGPTLESPDGS